MAVTHDIVGPVFQMLPVHGEAVHWCTGVYAAERGKCDARTRDRISSESDRGTPLHREEVDTDGDDVGACCLGSNRE